MILPNHDRYQDYTEAELEEHRRVHPRHADRMIVLAELQKWQKKKDDEIAKDRHRDNWILGRKTLWWARWAVLAAVVVPVGIALISDIRTSRSLPATSSLASPTSSPQAVPNAVPSETPTATESPSATPLESPTPQAEK